MFKFLLQPETEFVPELGLWTPDYFRFDLSQPDTCRCCKERVVSQYNLNFFGFEFPAFHEGHEVLLKKEKFHNFRLHDLNFWIPSDLKFEIPSESNWFFGINYNKNTKYANVTNPFLDPYEEFVSKLKIDGKLKENTIARVRHMTNKQLFLEEWLNEDLKLHSNFGPAVIQYDDNGDKSWEEYYDNGFIFRSNGPARIEWEPQVGRRKETWRTSSKFRTEHRVGGPAIIYYQDDVIFMEEYMQQGVLHREDGPAVISRQDGSIKRFWYYQGWELVDFDSAINNGIQGITEYILNKSETRDDQQIILKIAEKSGLISNDIAQNIYCGIMFSK